MGKKRRHTEAGAAAGLFGNAGLAMLKGVTGFVWGSPALLSDAVRSASNAVLSVAPGVRGSRAINGPARTGGPVRVRSAVRIIASPLLILLGLEMSISAIRSIASGVQTEPQWIPAAVVIAAFLLKELVATPKERGIDFFASLLAFIGTGGAYAGKYLSLGMLRYLDPAAAIVISLIVVLNGYRLISTSLLSNEKPGLQQAETDELTEAAQRIDGVITIEQLKAWEQGHYVFVDVRISVNPRITVLEGNDIAKRVKELLMRRFIHIADVTVSVEPYDPGYPYKSNHDPNQEHMPTLLQ